MGLVLNKVQRGQWLSLLATNSRKDNATVIGQEPSGGVKSTRSILMQNIISSNSGSLTMSSREIAELVDSRHDKVKQSIDRLSDRGVIGVPPVGEYLDGSVANFISQEVQS